MKRARPWKIALLVALVGLGVGFTRLEGRRHSAPVTHAAPLPKPSADPESEARLGEQGLRELTTFLREMGQGWRPVQPLPPVDRLPPLPAELLPNAEGVTDPS
ncbi:MAG: hypothetical protein L0Z62_27115 [Gemmataceae bacterium]|nr:hypothetical protein [Gemmataceae bacterium]